MSISDAQVNEGNSGIRNLEFTVSLNRPSNKTITATFSIADSSATTALALGQPDYFPDFGNISFAPGITQQTISVRIGGDRIFEDNEVFTVELGSLTNATLLDSVGVGTIVNDDLSPTVSVRNAVAAEGSTLAFRVTLSNPSEDTVKVN